MMLSVHEVDARSSRAAVLEAVSGMLAEGDRVTVGRVARSMRLPRRTVRLHFRTGDRMVEAVAVAVTQQLVGEHPRLHPGGAAEEWGALMDAIWRDAALVKALLVAGRQRSGSALGDLLQPLLWSKAAIIARGQEQGLFRTDRSAADLGAETQRACLAALLESGGTVGTAKARTLAILQPTA